MGQKKLRLLMLHSFRTSKDIFAEQMHRAALDEKLKDLADLEYINAPHDASGDPPADVKPYFKGPYFEWWNSVQDEETGKWTYEGAEESMHYVYQYAQQHGPYDGVIAMSQGTILITLMLIARQAATTPQAHLLGRFCVLIAGVPPRKHYQMQYRNLNMPTLHMIGDRDPIKHMSYRLMSMFENPVLIAHPRGHVVPALEGAKLDTLRAFLLAQSSVSRL